MDKSRRSKAIEIGYSPARGLIQNHNCKEFPTIYRSRKRDLPRIMTETLATHTQAAIATTTLYKFHMATLEALMSA